MPGLCPDVLFPRDVLAYFAGEARDRLILADDEAPEVLPGIDAFYIGGHTLCSQAFTVQTKQGLAVFPATPSSTTKTWRSATLSAWR